MYFVAQRGGKKKMLNKVEISKNIINNYKNDKDVLKELKLRVISGSCSVYDMALYDAIIKENKKEKTLNLANRAGA